MCILLKIVRKLIKRFYVLELNSEKQIKAANTDFMEMHNLGSQYLQIHLLTVV